LGVKKLKNYVLKKMPTDSSLLDRRRAAADKVLGSRQYLNKRLKTAPKKEMGELLLPVAIQ